MSIMDTRFTLVCCRETLISSVSVLIEFAFFMSCITQYVSHGRIIHMKYKQTDQFNCYHALMQNSNIDYLIADNHDEVVLQETGADLAESGNSR